MKTARTSKTTRITKKSEDTLSKTTVKTSHVEWYQKLAIILFGTVVGFGALFAAWILFLRVNVGLELGSARYLLVGFILVIAIAILLYYYFKRRPDWLARPIVLRGILAFSLLVGLGIRLSFISFNGYYEPFGGGSDTGIHWYTAQEILETGEIQAAGSGVYEANFPYLTTYTGMVAVAMKILGVNYLAILVPNIICDLLVALIVYILLKKWKNQQAATFGVALALLNPLSIFFCMEGLALSYTNLFIALVLTCVYFLWQGLKARKHLAYFGFAALTGLVMSIGNSFRSLFVVFLLALAIFLTIVFLRSPSRRQGLVIFGGLAVVGLTFCLSNLVIDGIHHKLNPYYDEKHGSLGWSFFVGANFENAGRWSAEDWSLIAPRLYGVQTMDENGDTKIVVESLSPAELNRYFMQAGIDRYKDMSILNLLVHMVNKTEILFCRNEITIFRNLEEQFLNVSGFESWYLLANDAGAWMLTLFAILICLFFWQVWKYRDVSRIDYFACFVVLCFCGLFASSLLVEVMSRYVSVFIVPFVILGAVGLAGWLGYFECSIRQK